MKLSVVILTCNQTAVTRRCLDSLAPLAGYTRDLRVIVVDNGSEDDTSVLTVDCRPELKSSLELIKLPENIGVAPGRNVGLKSCMDSDYVLILDNDTIVPSGAIEALVDYMEANPATGLCAPKLESPDGRCQNSYKAFPGVPEKIRNMLGRSPYAEIVPDKPMEPFYVIGACQMIRGEVMRNVGLLDDNIFFGPEDADYCMRIREAGYKVVYLPWVTVIHDWQRKSVKSPFSAVSRHHLRGLLYFYRKWHRFI